VGSRHIEDDDPVVGPNWETVPSPRIYIIPADWVTCKCPCGCPVRFVSSEFTLCFLCSIGKHVPPEDNGGLYAKVA
jgi:hypothetical protein